MCSIDWDWDGYVIEFSIGSWYLGIKYLIRKYLVPSTSYRVLGTKYMVPSTRYQVLGTRYLCLASSTWYQVPGTKYLVPTRMPLNLAVLYALMSINSAQATRVCHLCMVTFNLPHPVYIYIPPPPAQGHAPQTLRTTPGPTAAVVALTVRAAFLPPGGADGPRPDGGGGGRHGAGAPPPPPEALQ